MRIAKFLGPLALLALSPVPAGAVDNLYDVEVLVFENRLPDLEGGEMWNRDTVDTRLPGLADSLPASPGNLTGSPLAGSAEALKRDGRYRVLSHQRWTQVADARSTVKAVRIQALDASDPTELDGTVRFYMSRFLHLDVNLLFRPDGENGAQVYRLSEQRKVKSKETNYFDHPKFGVLVRITPLSGS